MSEVIGWGGMFGDVGAADVAAREREGGETPKREGMLEEDADREKW